MASFVFEKEKLESLRRVMSTLLNGETSPRLHILSKISEDPDSTREELAEDLGITPQTVSMHIRALEEEGLLIVRRDESDLRRKVYVVTPLGIEILRTLRKAADEIHLHYERHGSSLKIRRQMEELNRIERSLLRRMRKAEEAGDYRQLRKLSGQLEELRRKRGKLVRKMAYE